MGYLSTDISLCRNMGCTSVLHWKTCCSCFCGHARGQGRQDTVNKTSHWQMWECLPGLLDRKKRCFVFHHSCSVCLADLFLFHTRTKKGIDISAWPQTLIIGTELSQNKIIIFQVAFVIHELMQSTDMVQGQCGDVAVLKEKGKHCTFISSGCMLLSRLSRMFSDFPCVLDSSSARTQETDVQNNCRSTALPESILQYLLTIAQKQFTETFPFLGSKIFPCITSIKVYYYSLLGLSKAELQH